MRKTIFSGLLGFLSVSVLAGCGLFRNDRCSDKGGCGTTRVYKHGETAIEFGPIDKSASGVKPGLIAPARAMVHEPPLAKANSIPIAAPENFLPEPKEERVPIPTPVIPRPIERPDVEIGASKPAGSPAPIKISESTRPIAKPSEPKRGPVTLGQSDNFKVVTGQVSLYRKTWRLRYAGVDQEDAYGGVLALEGGAELTKLRDGQTVRVRGTLIPPADRSGSASYRVTAIEMLD